MNFLPKKVNFDICTFCNHKCTFCSNEDKRTLKDIVKLDDFRKVMKNITAYLNIEELGLSAKGEVLINKDLVNIILCSKKEFKIPYVYISSNGALLTEELTKEILSAGLDSIKLSINGIKKEDYYKIHQKDDFEKVIQNLKYLIKEKKENYPNLKILISAIIDIPKEIIKNALFDILKEDIKYINEILKYNITFTPKFENFSIKPENLKPCPLVENEIYIDSDCRLGLCCKDYFKEFDFGSLLTNDFLKLYNSMQMQGIRQMHKKREFEENHFCTKCLLFSEESKND
jgi:MoaA/NifB/PqqE/SkfB family radical SAM enzyme